MVRNLTDCSRIEDKSGTPPDKANSQCGSLAESLQFGAGSVGVPPRHMAYTQDRAIDRFLIRPEDHLAADCWGSARRRKTYGR